MSVSIISHTRSSLEEDVDDRITSQSWADLLRPASRLCLNSGLRSVSVYHLRPGRLTYDLMSSTLTAEKREENPIDLSHLCSNYISWFDRLGWQRVWDNMQTHSCIHVSPPALRGPSPVTWSITSLRLELESWPSVAKDEQREGHNALTHKQ